MLFEADYAKNYASILYQCLLAPSNLTFLIIAIDRNGFRRMKEEGLIYKTLPQVC